MKLFTKLTQYFISRINRRSTQDTVKESSVKSADGTDSCDSCYEVGFQKCLIGLADEVYGIQEPMKIAEHTLRTACAFYCADWCGIFDLDTMLGLWVPFWWYNNITDRMVKAKIEDGCVRGDFHKFADALEKNYPIYIDDIKNIKLEEHPAFHNQVITSVLAVPYHKRERGFLFLCNPKKYIDRPELLRVFANILVQEINEQKLLDRMKAAVPSEKRTEDVDMTVNLFGGLEICTKQGKLTEADMKSPLCSKVFVLLLLNCHRGMSAKEISEKLWSDKEYDNPTGNLRSLLYRLRTMFRLISDDALIVTTTNGYRINQKLHIRTDYEEFRKLCESAAIILDVNEKIGVLTNAMMLYRGKLFPSANGDHWQISHSSQYHLMYLKAVDDLSELLQKMEKHEDLYEFSLKVVNIEPNSPVIIYWLIVALRKKGAIDMAKRHLESAKERLLEEEYRELEERLQFTYKR